MQTIKRTIVKLEDGEEITIETAGVALTVKADIRGDAIDQPPMLVVSTTQQMFDDDQKEICYATIEI